MFFIIIITVRVSRRKTFKVKITALFNTKITRIIKNKNIIKSIDKICFFKIILSTFMLEQSWNKAHRVERLIKQKKMAMRNIPTVRYRMSNPAIFTMMHYNRAAASGVGSFCVMLSVSRLFFLLFSKAVRRGWVPVHG